jgi:hypothetical protein
MRPRAGTTHPVYPKPGDVIHLYDLDETGPACGRGVGWVDDTLDEVNCSECRAKVGPQ